MDFHVLTVHNVNQVWTVVFVDYVFLVVQEQDHPPMVSTTVDFATATYLNVCAVVYLDKVPVHFGH